VHEFEHGRQLWFWEFLALLFGVNTAEGEVEEHTEVEPKAKIDCVTSEFGTWGFCTPGKYNTCWEERSRRVITSPQHGGSGCGSMYEERICDCVDACGDGKVTLGEECEDGNHENGDGCR